MKIFKTLLKIQLLVVSILVLTFANSCEKGGDDIVETSFTDPRDGNVYQIVTIGDQVWMAENLRYLPSVDDRKTGSTTTPCYYVLGYYGTSVEEAKTSLNYQNYGVLYNWPAVMVGEEISEKNPSGVRGISPEGWHIPSNAEWEKLAEYLSRHGCNYDRSVGGGSAKIAKSMAISYGWQSYDITGSVGNGDYPEFRNKSGFSAGPSGERDSNGLFNGSGYGAYWWSTSAYSNGQPCVRYLWSFAVDLGIDYYDRSKGLSVRCVKDK